MKIADFRTQGSTVPSTPTDGVIGIYANGSGVLQKINSAGTVSDVTADFTKTYVNAQISTGLFTQTGACFGSATTNNTGLGAPTIWAKINISGTVYGVPAYALR